METVDRRLLYKQFQEVFPIESLKDMPLEKYTNLNREDSFCYWLEFKTLELGSIFGGSSFKFGIYEYQKLPKANPALFKSDGRYAWYSKYNKDTAEDAFNYIRKAIVSIAEHARRGDFTYIDNIDVFGEVLKWKIAFLYSNEKLIPIFKREFLELVSEQLGMFAPKNRSIIDLQRFLMSKKGETDLYVFYDKLVDIIDNRDRDKGNLFQFLKKELKEKLNTDDRFSVGKGGPGYIWIGTSVDKMDTKECHYEVRRVKSNNREKVFVELHCESNNADKYKSLADIEGVHVFPWSGFAVRRNEAGWYMTDHSLKELADIVIEELYNLDDLIGEELKSIRNASNEKIKYWIYAPGENASQWPLCQEKSLICIAWPEMGDFSQYESIVEVRNKMQEVYPDVDSDFKNNGLAVWQFAHEMKPGDIIYVKQGQTKILGKGFVTSDYIYNKSFGEYPNIRMVKWMNVGEWEAPYNNTLKTLTDITAFPNDVKALESLFKDGGAAPKNYWWLVANPKIWSFNEMKVGEVQDYTLYNENDRRRRIFQNFLDAKEGDLVIGYESTPTKQIVALAEVEQANDGERIFFRKTESLPSPIDFSAFRSIPELADMEFLKKNPGAFFKLTEDEYNILLDLIREENPLKQDYDKYTEADFLNEVYISADSYRRMKDLLLTKKNIILQGAPGVGKTFAAKRLAYSIMEEKDESRVEFIQFHQSYTYEDFIMGYKPNEEGGFYLKPGVFYSFCKRAKADPERPYFFIIDEINRGNLSKIFGELLMLIEKDYRGEKVKLAYKDEKFNVPENLHIIGMMNTADRSLAMIDYALRRRFSFVDMHPGFESEGFKKYKEGLHSYLFDRTIEKVIKLNELIEEDDSLGEGFCIGHSYFCNQEYFSKEWLQNVIDYDIIPMLREYWFDNSEQYKKQKSKLEELFK